MHNLKMKNEDTKKTIATNITLFMDIYSKTRKEVCQDLNIKYTTFCDWVNAKTYPRMEALEQLAYYFRVEVRDFLIETSENSDMTKRIAAYAKRMGVYIGKGDWKMKELEDLFEQDKYEKVKFKHKTLEERAEAYGGQVGHYEEMDYGQSVGREIW